MVSFKLNAKHQEVCNMSINRIIKKEIKSHVAANEAMMERSLKYSNK